MRKPLCVVSADWHLERNAWVRHPELAGDSYYGLQQVVDLALLMKLPIIAAGDLFNKPYPDAKSVHVAVQQMDRMQAAELGVYYTQGQHERTKDLPWLGLHPWPIHLHKQSVIIGAYRFIGLDYTRPDDLIAELNSIHSDADVLVAHQVWKEFMGVKCNSDDWLSSVPHVSVVLTGDFHKHTSLKIKGASNQKMLVLSPGSLCLQSLDEPAAKAVYVLYDNFTYESVPIKSRVITNFDITSKEDMYDLMSTIGYGVLEPQQGVPDNIAKPIVSIRYNPEVEEAYSRLSELVGDRAHLFIKPINNTVLNMGSFDVIEDESQATIDAGLEGNLIKHCSNASLTYTIAMRLLQASNVKEELAALEEQYLEGS